MGARWPAAFPFFCGDTGGVQEPECVCFEEGENLSRHFTIGMNSIPTMSPPRCCVAPRAEAKILSGTCHVYVRNDHSLRDVRKDHVPANSDVLTITRAWREEKQHTTRYGYRVTCHERKSQDAYIISSHWWHTRLSNIESLAFSRLTHIEGVKKQRILAESHSLWRVEQRRKKD